MDVGANNSLIVFHMDSDVSLRSSADSAISTGSRRSVRFASLDEEPAAAAVQVTRKSGSRMRRDSEVDSVCSSSSLSQVCFDPRLDCGRFILIVD